MGVKILLPCIADLTDSADEDNADIKFQIISRLPKVRLLLTGGLHTERDGEREREREREINF